MPGTVHHPKAGTLEAERKERASEVDQPGLRALREAVLSFRPRTGRKRAPLRRDLLAGLNTAVNDVPDGMATALLVGVNPIHGLYAGMVGPVVGGLFSSTPLMVITTTSAAALAAGEAIARLPADSRPDALFLMVILIGAIQILAGVLRLGRVMRFISYSVMSGLLLGIALLIGLSQLPPAAGYEAQGGGALARVLDLVANLDAAQPQSIGIALFALLLAFALPRTRLGAFGLLLAVAIPSAASAVFRLEGVQVVRDMGEIPSGFPSLFVPSFSEAFQLLSGAFAVAVIVLAQGAGVSQSVNNPDGSRSSASRDFIAQGAANVASGLFRGVPVGGSLGMTALNVASGAASRRAAIVSGVWTALIVIVFPGLVAHVALPALAALLIVASLKTIKVAELVSVWHTGWPSRIAAAATFLSTLLLPVELAVGIGVGISAIIYLSESSADVSLVELVETAKGRLEERNTPERLAPGKPTVLDVYGNLFFAGARTLERRLPDPEGAQNAVVILRLRGRTSAGATLIEVLSDYAEKLRAVNGRLYLSGISDEVHDQFARTDKLRLHGPVRIYEATPVLGEATRRAYEDAQAWLVSLSKEERK